MTYHKKDFKGGGRKGGFNRGGGGFGGRKESFKATCADCGSNCTVPFKPNGRKPILCSDCFQGGERSDSGRSGYREKKAFKPKFEKRGFDKRSNDSGMKEDMKEIKRKLDRILDILQAVEIIEEDI